jgi:hypothetical protein
METIIIHYVQATALLLPPCSSGSAKLLETQFASPAAPSASKRPNISNLGFSAISLIKRIKVLKWSSAHVYFHMM